MIYLSSGCQCVADGMELLAETGTDQRITIHTKRRVDGANKSQQLLCSSTMNQQQPGNAGGYGVSNSFVPKQDMEYICAGAYLQIVKPSVGRAPMEHRL